MRSVRSILSLELRFYAWAGLQWLQPWLLKLRCATTIRPLPLVLGRRLYSEWGGKYASQ